MTKQEVKTETANSNFSIISFIILSTYLCVELVSLENYIDHKAIHWLLISVINVLGLGYCLGSGKVKSLTKSVVKQNWLYTLLMAFLMLSALSLFVGINLPQGLISLSMIASMVCMAIVFFVLLYQQKELFSKLMIVLMVITLYESFSSISYLFKNIGSDSIRSIVKEIKGNFSNQNIFAFSLVVKLPLLIYGFIHFKKAYLKVIVAITVWLSFLTIYFLQSRAAFLAIIGQVVMLLIGLGIIYLRRGEKRRFITQAIVIAGLYLTSLGVYQVIYNNARTSNNQSEISLSDNAINRPLEEEIRIKYWKNTLAYISEKPFLGYGVGNFEFYIPQYYSKLADGNKFSRHPHNELLNISAESGVLNGLIYLSLFVIAFIFTLRILFSSEEKYPIQSKIIAVIAITALAGYFMDVNFNFPLSRPPMQVLFALVFAIITVNYLAYKNTADTATPSKLAKPLLSLLLVFGLGTIYVNYQLHASYQVQSKMMPDLSNLNKNPKYKLRFSYNELVDELPTFPNIAADTEPIGFKLARYLYKEGKKEKALHLLDSTQQYSPYTGYNAYLQSDIYNSMDKPDSTFAYAKKAYLLRPRNLNYYKTACAMAVKTNDQKSLTLFYDTYFSYGHKQEDAAAAFYTYLSGLIRTKADVKTIQKLVKEGAEKYPEHEVINKLNRKLNPGQSKVESSKEEKTNVIEIKKPDGTIKRIERKGNIQIIRNVDPDEDKK